MNTDPQRFQSTRYLVENGPSTREEMGIGSVRVGARAIGARRFDPTISNHGCGAGGQVQVWWYEPEHSPEDVVRAWFEANPRVVEEATPRQALGAIRDAGPEFREIARDVVTDVYGEDAYDQSFAGGS